MDSIISSRFQISIFSFVFSFVRSWQRLHRAVWQLCRAVLTAQRRRLRRHRLAAGAVTAGKKFAFLTFRTLSDVLDHSPGLDIQTARKFSNGRKIARIAPIWTKICQNRSQRPKLSVKKFSAPFGFKKHVFEIFFAPSAV